MAKHNIFVVGSSNTDLVVHTKRLPNPGETVLGSDLQTFAGGKGANQAVAAARCSKTTTQTIFIGAFGNDDFGRARRNDLESDRIDCSRCLTIPNISSGAALIGIGSAGNQKAENLILVAPGANGRLTKQEIKKQLKGKKKSDAPKRGDILLTQLETPIPTVETALQAAKRNGALTILNPAPLTNAPSVRKLLKWTDIVVPNETELELLFGKKSAKQLFKKSKQPATLPPALRNRHTLVTLGSNGMVWVQPSGKKTFLKPPKVKPVDTVGAGDCFCGSLAAGLVGLNPDELNENTMLPALQFSLHAASINVTRHGAQSGMPKRNEVLRFMK